MSKEMEKAKWLEKIPNVYEVDGEIGSGTGGTVFHAYHKGLRKEVVIKRINVEVIMDEDMQRSEADILKDLHHQYLPQVFDYFFIDGVGYTVMDYIHGVSLQKMLNNGHRFKQAEVLKYARQLCEAVGYLHSRKIPIIHGDIKPDNIMLTSEDNICLIDFNISGISKDGKAETFGYTQGYGAPEQLLCFMKLQEQLYGGTDDTGASVGNAGEGIGHDTVMLEHGESPGSKTGGTRLLPHAETDAAPGNVSGSGDTRMLSHIEAGAAQERNTRLLSYVEPPPDAGNESRARDTRLLSFSEAGVSQERQDRKRDTVLLWGGEEGGAAGQPERGGGPKRQTLHVQNVAGSGIPIDTRTDVYSIGATIFHLYSGKSIDQAGNLLLKEGTSEGLLYILNKALQNDPAKRFKDASEMLRSLNSIHRQDMRYKRMLVGQNLIRIAIICMAASGLVMINAGRAKLHEESDDYYTQCISRMEAALNEGDDEAFAEAYGDAVASRPHGIDAYYQKVLYLFKTHAYEEAAEYINQEVLGLPEQYDREILADIYYILGECYFELENYGESEKAFASAIKNNGRNAAYYTDRAIVLARLSRTDEAGELLEAAQKIGIGNANLNFVQGEICIAAGEYGSAEDYLRACVLDADDDYMRQQAYLAWDDLYKKKEKEQKSQEILDAHIKMLQEAETVWQPENRFVVLERLAQVYMDAAAIYDVEDYGYTWKAIETWNEIVRISRQWDMPSTHLLLARLYTNVGDVADAEAELSPLSEQYPDDYRVPMRFAYLECVKQNEKDNSEREYHTFDTYYQKAIELYKDSQQTDDEMQYLEKNVYPQLVEGNWLP